MASHVDLATKRAQEDRKLLESFMKLCDITLKCMLQNGVDLYTVLQGKRANFMILSLNACKIGPVQY